MFDKNLPIDANAADPTFMSNEAFMAKCNELGEAKKRVSVTFDEAARLCGHIPGFSARGLSFLASLLSDASTASGQLNEQGAAPDPSKVWSMSFLARFNPEGHVCIENPALLRAFARQISEGKELFELSLHNDVGQFKGKAQLPSQAIVCKIIDDLRRNGEGASLELIHEGIEDYYAENDMLLPADWEKTTTDNVRKWYGIQ